MISSDAIQRGQIVLAANRNGGILRLIASLHDDDDDDDYGIRFKYMGIDATCKVRKPHRPRNYVGRTYRVAQKSI